MGRGKLATKKAMIWILFILMIFVAGTIIYLYFQRDAIPPEISFPPETRVLTEAEAQEVRAGEYSCLLSDVRVTDDKDGEIDDRIIIMDVNTDEDLIYAIVRYRAMDSANNINTVRRIIYLEEANNFEK